jgi:hypothetical protein
MENRARSVSEPLPETLSFEEFVEILEGPEEREVRWTWWLLIWELLCLLGEEPPDLVAIARVISNMIKHRRYRTMEAAANRLQKESKGYLDSLRGTYREIDLGVQR